MSKRALHALPYFVIALLGVVLLWHCQHGFCQSDETYYAALPHRFWSGDAMFVDERDLTQIYAPLLVPFYSLYRVLVPSGEGVLFAFRLGYVVFALSVSVALYYRASREALPFASLCATLLILMYSRANINGPSYYNVCMCLTIVSVIFLHAPHDQSSRLLSSLCVFLSGVSFTCAAFCNPYLTPFFSIMVIVGYKLHPGKVRWMLVGACLTVSVYMVYVISGAGLVAFIKAMKAIMREYGQTSETNPGLADKVRTFLNNWSLYVPPVVYILTVFFLIERAVFRRGLIGIQVHRVATATYWILGLLTVLRVALLAKTSVCFAVSAPACTLLLPDALEHVVDERGNKPIFASSLYWFGVILAVCFFLGSNTVFDAMTTGFTLATVGGVLLVGRRGVESSITSVTLLKGVTNAARIACCLLILAVFLAHRMLGTYRDARVQNLTVRLEEGPAARLLTTPDHAKEYNTVLATIRQVHEKYPKGGVCFSRILPWGYLVVDWACNAEYSWRTVLSNDELIPYYTEEGHEFPDFVFVMDESTASYETAPFNNHVAVSAFNKQELTGSFYSWLIENGRIEANNEYVTVYYIP